MISQDGDLFKMLYSAGMAIISTLAGWLHLKINRIDDSKLGKDVFKEFKEGNTEAHQRQEDQLKAIWEEIRKK